MTMPETEKYLSDLRNEIGRAIDEVETGGMMCNVGVHIALMDAWNKLGYIY